MQVVLGHRVQPFGRHTAAPGNVLQERPHLLGPFRSAERQQQDGIKLHAF
ncbi:Uncharacterised protein [Mycobacterium tuberculosis]|uniref:Uncharacterized protein n=1 Tax=Mycobacterium tuberculosis TaxID=1773 RepID=A0A0T9D034_MYCTX|nr:hypothetical protein CAB90_01673 [Mycobacterium tuberculosis]CFS15930.1 Uncharacterised protein [Mycobacterium tuberculosis]CKN85903.1 Uncharacterised protein [Mycobacterium tuberculosis]CKR17580.1 Uncharacterised protein [Mycobacterium tuberculosis]CKR40476.1 Uncharacterised protein [Mycobacterium tuberculosis]